MRPLTSWATWSLLAAMCILFVSTTLQLAISIGFPMSQIRGYLIATDVPLGERRDLWIAEHKRTKAFSIGQTPSIGQFRILLLFGAPSCCLMDIGLFEDIFLLVMAADLFFWVYYSAVVTHHTIESGEYLGLETDLKLGTAANYLSLGTNVMGTLCIAVKAWQHHKLMNATANKNLRNPSPVTRIMFILVETGAFFAALQLVTVVLAQVDLTAYTPLDYATTAITHAATLIADTKSSQHRKDNKDLQPSLWRQPERQTLFLRHRANVLHALKYYYDTVKDASEAQKTYRELHDSRFSKRYTTEYVESLGMYSRILLKASSSRRSSGPHAKDSRALGTARAEYPDVYRPKLAHGLVGLFTILNAIGHYLEAENKICEATEIFCLLAADSPELFNPELHRKFSWTRSGTQKLFEF
ncbi:hypothetical protein B0H14DRAFT_3731598 [Mycena olivaceomarginata]|nr:hypothetical protein B0H14DRAFT_3731598 [Mycena olivaceomarginata]